MARSTKRSKISSAAARIRGLLGPGLITGAADDDPSGIATYSQAGAQFGYGLVWTMFLSLPFMAAVQILSAWVGWNTRKGLAANFREHMPRALVYALVCLLAIANTINIAADLAAMSVALKLVIGGPPVLYAFLFGFACLVAEIFVPYHRYAGFLKFLTLALFVYVATAFTISVPWGEVFVSMLVPRLPDDHDALLMIVAVFGTTISPYLFFWQAGQEVENSALSHRRLYRSDRMSRFHLRRIAIDTSVGMFFSNLIAFFIIVTAAATLHANGITKIETAAQAAEALRPLAGELTFLLFAAGIIGTGLLAVPVLAGSAAYAIAEAFGFKGSLELPASRAIGFYILIGSATLVGAGLAAAEIDAIQLLFWAAVVNGVLAAPILFAMMWLVTRPLRARMNDVKLPRSLIVFGWLAALLMAIVLLLTFLPAPT